MLFGTERNTVCYPGPFVTLATGVLQDMDLRTSHRQPFLLGDALYKAHYADVRERALNLRPPERACAGSGHWKNSVGVGFAGGRSGRYDVLDRRNAAMPAHAYGTVAPGECDTSGRPEISAPVALAGVYGATTQALHPSLGSALNGLTY